MTVEPDNSSNMRRVVRSLQDQLFSTPTPSRRRISRFHSLPAKHTTTRYNKSKNFYKNGYYTDETEDSSSDEGELWYDDLIEELENQQRPTTPQAKQNKCNKWSLRFLVASAVVIILCFISIATSPAGASSAASSFLKETREGSFSPLAFVEVNGKGQVPISALELGDKVLASNGQYQTVYHLGHFDFMQPTRYIQIHFEVGAEDDASKTSEMEVTSQHLVFKQGSDVPTLAKNIRVGDKLQLVSGGAAKVTKVSLVARRGSFAPLTADGTIVVNGIVTSTYQSFQTNSDYVKLGGKHRRSNRLSSKNHNNANKIYNFLYVGRYTTTLSQHSAVDILLSPYRTLCLNANLKETNSYFHSMKLDTRIFHFRTWMKNYSNIFVDTIIMGLALLVALPFYMLNSMGWVYVIGTTTLVVLTTTSFLCCRSTTTKTSRNNNNLGGDMNNTNTASSLCVQSGKL